MDTALPAPDELDLAAQSSDEPAQSHELERLLSGRVFTIGTNGTVSAWSERAHRTFGFTNAGIVGESFAEKLIAPPGREKRAGEIAALLANEGPPVAVHIETRALNADGSEFAERFAVVPIRLHDGYELNGLLQDLAKFRREDDRPRLREAHSSVISVIEAELAGRVEPPVDGGEEAERLVGALVIFDGGEAPAVSAVHAESAKREEQPEEVQREFEELRERIERLQREADEARHDAYLAREEVEKTRSKLNDVRGSAEDEQGRAERLDAEVSELRAASEQAEARLEESRERAERAEAELEKARRVIEIQGMS